MTSDETTVASSPPPPKPAAPAVEHPRPAWQPARVWLNVHRFRKEVYLRDGPGPTPRPYEDWVYPEYVLVETTNKTGRPAPTEPTEVQWKTANDIAVNQPGFALRAAIADALRDERKAGRRDGWAEALKREYPDFNDAFGTDGEESNGGGHRD